MEAAGEGIVALTADDLEPVSGGWCGTPYPGWWRVGPLPQPDPIFRPALATQSEVPAAATTLAAIGSPGSCADGARKDKGRPVGGPCRVG
jgi:hypothetical protein